MSGWDGIKSPELKAEREMILGMAIEKYLLATRAAKSVNDLAEALADVLFEAYMLGGNHALKVAAE